MENITVPFSSLVLSDLNVRKTAGDLALDALAASILEHGLIQPLVVTAIKARRSTSYAVHAGGRRCRAIAQLIETGKLPQDHGVDVRVFANRAAAAREISLAENLIRESMSPADECRAFKDIIDTDGADAEDIARRFGLTVRHVQGRLRLADLAEPIFAALAAGDITLDIAMAYCATADRDRQLAAWERLSAGWQAQNAQTIRRAVAETAIASSHPVALFLGEDEYRAGGGRIESDLFAASGEGMWLDGEIATELATKKLAYEAEIAALGGRYGWVTPVLAAYLPYELTKDLHPFYPSRVDPAPEVQARLDEIEVRIDELNEVAETSEDEAEVEKAEAEMELLSAEYDKLGETCQVIRDEDKPNVGVFLILEKDGTPALHHQLYTTVKPGRAAASGQAGSSTGSAGTAKTDGFSRSLEENLAKERRDVLALHVATDPAMALDLVIFRLAIDCMGFFTANDTGLSIKIGDRFEPAGLVGVPPSQAVVDLDAVRSALPHEWSQADDLFTAFLEFRGLDEEAKASWLAYAVSQSLKASLDVGWRGNAFLSGVGAMMEIDVAAHWRPGAENYFDRLKKGQILTALGQIDPELPARYATAKKGELALAAAKLCAGDTITDPAVKQRAAAWLPEAMRFTAKAPAEADSAAQSDANGDEGPIASGDCDAELIGDGEDGLEQAGAPGEPAADVEPEDGHLSEEVIAEAA
ncbi:ParB/RepB/Spo0J family partition protein [Novosphingobium sp. G106]|uniref:ParB/RepB/Spo0J family partition protein n=1 Tax=Novosphingobium sp. G106 TaxID=2849500 RepID=UPI001C2D03EE|nr:ParB/RepB/Spo0J family partition protein [Novosphingobium sp. G106]MBV1692495.1 ParB/RepB/Spo0J family partition protein [Novosphingobium sp. G106]